MAGRDFGKELFGNQAKDQNEQAGRDFGQELFGKQATKPASFSLRDLAASFGMGATGSTKAITEAFGADNAAARKLEQASQYLQSAMTPERQAELARQQQRMKEAEKQGTLAEIGAAFRNVAEAPLQSTAQALGSFVPYLPALFATPVATALRLAPGAIRAVTAAAEAAPAVIGTAQGAGAVKGSIYDGVLRAEIEAGTPEGQARDKAAKAQEYFGKNFEQIALGAGLGYGAARFGAERLLTSKGREGLPAGVAKRVGVTSTAEAGTEAAQASQERAAQNIAQQREGFDVPTFQGVAGAATQEGLMGALGAAPVAAISRPTSVARPPVAEPPAPPATTAPPAPPSREQKVIDEITGVSRPAAPEPMSLEEARVARARKAQEDVETAYKAEEERARKLGPRPSVPAPPLLERSRPGLDETTLPKVPELSALLEKQRQVEDRRIAAGIPTSTVMPEPTKPEPSTEPKLVDNRPLTERAAKNRLLVMKNMLKNEGGDPESLQIVPHPTVPERFAITSLDRPTTFTPGLPGTAATREPTEPIVDPVQAYVNRARATNTPAATRFVRDYDQGLITTADVEQALEAERKAGRPLPFTYTATGEPGIVAPGGFKARAPATATQLELKDISDKNGDFAVDSVADEGGRKYVVSATPTLDLDKRLPLTLTSAEQAAADAIQGRLDQATTTEERVEAENLMKSTLRRALARNLMDVKPQKFVPPTGEDLPPPVEPPPVEPPPTEPPPPTVEPPKTADELRQRLPVLRQNKEIEAANMAGNFGALIDALEKSSNPIIQKIGNLSQKIRNKITLNKSTKRLAGYPNAAGLYNSGTDTIIMRSDYAGDEHTSAHEVVHALTVKSMLAPNARQRPIVKEIEELYQYVKKELAKQGMGWDKDGVPRKYSRQVYGTADPFEFVSEANTNPEFQFLLMKIPYKGKRSAWTQFTRLVANLLGISDVNALTEIINLTDKLTAIPGRGSMFNRGKGEIYASARGDREISPIGFYSALSDAVSKVDEGIELFNVEQPTSQEVQAAITKAEGTPAEQAKGILNQTGMQPQPPEQDRVKKILESLRSMGENPQLTKESAKATLKQWTDKLETMAFSGDAAFNNNIRRNLVADLNEHPEIMGLMLEASQSQAVHADALATQFIIEGGIAYDEEAKKWVAVKKEDNFIKLSKSIDALAAQYKIDKQEAERIAHTYFVAKRFKSLAAKQDQRDAEIAELEDKIKTVNSDIRRETNADKRDRLNAERDGYRKQIDDLKKAEVYISEDQRAMIDPGMRLADIMPELKDISDIWQGIRTNAVKALMDGQLWSLELAEAMLDNVDYVPFYRDEQLEEGGGPQEFIRGLQVKAKEFRLKGSNAPVHDVFDNMVRWTQYAINRSVRNHKALQMIDIGKEIQTGDRKMVTKVEKLEPGKNIVRVFRNGVQELYEVADPLYMDAFTSISNVAIPSIKFFSWFANMLRNSVVLYPLFSVAQVPQDAFSAMFTSGLKPRYALRIPVLAVKEFVKTLNKTSATHNLLKKYGATGVRDFSAAVARQDVEIAAGLKPPKTAAGKGLEYLSHIAMSADNAIRQAVYEASMQQGLSKAEALEKAFDIINFRRRGSSKMINLMGQVIPFFYAYMSVQRVAMKTISGVGISPGDRKEALKTLATMSGGLMAMSVLYAMLVADDEDYQDTPTAIRDRVLVVPGTGMRIPLRPDLFLMPKVISEHAYHLITDNGLSDPKKARKSIMDGLVNAMASPMPVPQAIKPALEVAVNYDFFQGKPVVGFFEKQKEAERQFTDSTSEFSKILGSAGVSPIVADHLIRGMFGSVGGLFLYTTNFMLHSDMEVDRPSVSLKDMLAAVPGTGGFVAKSTENALKNDFYELRDEVAKTKATFNDIKNRSPQGIEDFINDEKNITRLGLAKTTEKVSDELSKIRRAISQVTNAPNDLMDADEKQERIKELREIEKEMLKSVGIKELRAAAKL